MQRSRFPRWTVLGLPGLITLILTLILTAGCAHHTTPTVPPTTPAPPSAMAQAQPAAFQPYTLLPAPPPAPPAATHRRRVLHLTRVHEHTYLEDSDRHLYEAGRDTQGHIYPIYRDPATHVTYPLYYDPARDNLYRLAQSDNRHFYRNYVGQPNDNFYDSDRDYERISPSDDDRPIVTDSYNTYNYNEYDYGSSHHHHDAYYGNYRPYNEDPDYGQNHPYYTGYTPPPAHHSNHFNYNWLWAIPVIVGAYLLLHPHHSSPPSNYYRAPTEIVRQNSNVNITHIHNTDIHNTTVNNTTIINQAVPVGYQPIASRRPVYLYPAGYTPQPRYAPPVAQRGPDVRPHGPINSLIVAPLAVPALRAALAHPHPALPISRPMPRLIASHSAPPIPRPAILVTHRPQRVFHPAAARHFAPAERPRLTRRVFHPVVVRPAAPRIRFWSGPRPGPSVPERPRLVPSHAPTPIVIVHPRPEPVRHPALVTPRPVGRPRVVTNSAPVVRPNHVVAPSVRVPSHPRPAPRINHSAPPHRAPAPLHPAVVRPHLSRPALSPPKHDTAPKHRESPEARRQAEERGGEDE